MRNKDLPDRIIEVAIGMSDGLIVPFALASGMYATDQSNETIFETGLLVAGAGCLLLSIGAYLAGRSGLPRQKTSARQMPGIDDPVKEEEMATRQFLAKLDLETAVQDMAANDWKKEQDEWAELMADEMEKLKSGKALRKPWQYAASIGLSYLLGAAVPLLPFLLSGDQNCLAIAAALTLPLVFFLGILKSRATGQPWWKDSTRNLLLALFAAAGAFMAGYYFFK
ncbi:MAG: VIT1/CCC1 transporter family protein [Chitinophagaceae bacterium]